MLDSAPSVPLEDGPDPVLAEAPHRIGRVTLVVRDLETVARFYQDVIGLAPLRRDANSLSLGAGDAVLLDLRHDPAARLWSRREAGLFHTAFLLPSRADLGAWLRHMAERQLPIEGASDHIVSEAVYLTDPEGNGIEVYADRPSRTWTFEHGAVRMSTERLDMQGVMASARGRWAGMPAGSTIGHAHLQVGEVSRAGAFYGDLLGFDIMARYPGALFFGSGGYHHQFGANLWNSRGAPPRTDLTTGLAEVEVVVKTQALLQEICARLDAAATPLAVTETGTMVRDPWATALRLVVKG